MPGGVRILLCHCNSIFEHEVRACIRKGARSVDEVADACDAGTGCGSCRGTIETVLDEEAQRRRKGDGLPDALLQLPLFDLSKKPRSGPRGAGGAGGGAGGAGGGAGGAGGGAGGAG